MDTILGDSVAVVSRISFYEMFICLNDVIACKTAASRDWQPQLCKRCFISSDSTTDQAGRKSPRRDVGKNESQVRNGSWDILVGPPLCQRQQPRSPCGITHSWNRLSERSLFYARASLVKHGCLILATIHRSPRIPTAIFTT